MVDAALVLAAFAATIVLGFLGQLFFRLTRISDILILMGFGLALALLVTPIDPEPFRVLAPVIGTFALLIILFEGGLDLHFRELLSGLGRATALAVIGFAASVTVVALVGVFYLGLEPLTAVLLGTILGGSSSIAVMPIVKRLTVHPKTRVVLGVESALTDVLCVVGALTLVNILALGARPEVDSVGRAVLAGFSIAIVVGAAVGPLWLKLLDVMRSAGNIYMLTIAMVFVLFLFVENLGGTGAIAVLVFGVFLGNAQSLRKLLRLHGHGFGTDLRQFQSEVAFVVRAFFFVYLGLIFDVFALTQQILIGAAVLVGALAVGRYVAVWVAAAGSTRLRPDRGVWWALMPRGLAAAVLAGIPAAQGIPGTGSFVAYATLVIILTNLVGSLAGLFARRAPPEEEEVVPLEEAGELYELFHKQVNVPPTVEAPGAASEVRSSAGESAPGGGTPPRSGGDPPASD